MGTQNNQHDPVNPSYGRIETINGYSSKANNCKIKVKKGVGWILTTYFSFKGW